MADSEFSDSKFKNSQILNSNLTTLKFNESSFKYSQFIKSDLSVSIFWKCKLIEIKQTYELKSVLKDMNLLFIDEMENF